MGYPQPRDPNPLTLVTTGGLLTPEQRTAVIEMRDRVILQNGYATATWFDPLVDHPAVAYTVGLLERVNHPELVLVGVSTDREIDEDGHLEWSMAHIILGVVADRIVREGLRLAAGQTLPTIFAPTASAGSDREQIDHATNEADAEREDGPPPFPVAVRAVHPSRYDPYLLQALVRYGPEPLLALQLVYADDAGRFPWDAGCDPDLVAADIRLDLSASMDSTTAERPYGTAEQQAQAALAQMVGELAHTQALLGRSTAAIIKRHGWLVQSVLGTDDITSPKPPHNYTIGLLQQYQHPELAIVGLAPEKGAHILNALGEEVRNGHRFTDGETYAGLGGRYPVVLRAVHPSRFPTWFGRGMVDYERAPVRTDEGGVLPYAALQVVMCDYQGHFPWDADADDTFHSHQTWLYQAAVDPERY